MRWPRRSAPDVVEVMPFLLIGSAPDASEVPALRRLGVRHVLDLRAEREDEVPWGEGVAVKYAPIADRAAPDLRLLEDIVDWILGVTDAGETVLIHCHAGIGRSATVACAVLVRMGYPISDAYGLIRARRTAINPTTRQLDALRRYEALVRERHRH